MELTERIARDHGVLARLGIQVDISNDTDPSLRLEVAADMLNASGVCHGGLLFALADTACAYAMANASVTPITVDANITYMRGAKMDERVEATADVLREGRKLGHCEVTLALADGTVIARYRATSLNLPEPAAATDHGAVSPS